MPVMEPRKKRILEKKREREREREREVNSFKAARELRKIRTQGVASFSVTRNALVTNRQLE